MFNRIKFSLLLIILGVVLIIMGARDLKTSKAEPIDLNDSSVNWNDLQVGDHVEMDVDFLMDYFVVESKDGK